MQIRFLIVFMTIILLFNCSVVLAAGPWKGKVIDAETKKPIEGAVVLAVWDRNYRTPTGGNSYFYEAKEVLTDKEGKFEIPAYTPINLLPLISYIEGPVFTIFKPGYGSFPWYRVSPPMNIPPDEFFANETGTEGEIGWDYEKGKKIKVVFGIIELPKLKTWIERIKNLESIYVERIPSAKIPNLLQIIKEEDNYLSPVYGIDRNKLNIPIGETPK